MAKKYTRRITLRSPAAKFWKLVKPSGECWLWIGALTTSGYPVWCPSLEAPQILAARFAFELKYGRPPAHNLKRLCGNKLCVRAEHLSDKIKGKPAREVPRFEEEFISRIGPADERGCRLLLSRKGVPVKASRPSITVGGKQIRAAHISFLVHGNEIPEGKWILHSCDNEACIANEHLYAGTPLDNAQDRMNRGRHRHAGPVSIQEQELILSSPRSVRALAKEMNRTWTSVATVRRRGRVSTAALRGSDSKACRNGHPKEGDWATGGNCRLCNKAAVQRYLAKKAAAAIAERVQ